MKSCRQVTRLLSEDLDRSLTVSERMQLRVHCWMCSGCANFGLHMKQLRLMSRHFVRQPEPDPGLDKPTD